MRGWPPVHGINELNKRTYRDSGVEGLQSDTQGDAPPEEGEKKETQQQMVCVYELNLHLGSVLGLLSVNNNVCFYLPTNKNQLHGIRETSASTPN